MAGRGTGRIFRMFLSPIRRWENADSRRQNPIRHLLFWSASGLRTWRGAGAAWDARGVVLDSAGAAIQDADVGIRSERQLTRTNEQGLFRLIACAKERSKFRSAAWATSRAT